MRKSIRKIFAHIISLQQFSFRNYLKKTTRFFLLSSFSAFKCKRMRHLYRVAPFDGRFDILNEFPKKRASAKRTQIPIHTHTQQWSMKLPELAR